MERVALLIIYNHRFDKNIIKLEKIYRDKFSNIFHVIPFYDGEKENVITIYEHSYYFSGYIAQAYEVLKKRGFTHFVVCADDMILNPLITETSIWDVMGIDKDECFLPNFIELGLNDDKNWSHIIDGMRYTPKQNGVEIMDIIPAYEQAIEKFHYHRLFNSEVIPLVKAYNNIKTSNGYKKDLYSLLLRNCLKKSSWRYSLSYPLVGSYSDFFIVTMDVMPIFCKYCGAFAATNLFVELAIPTAMVLSAKKIRTESNTKLKGKAFWGDEVNRMCEYYDYNLTRLFSDFPKHNIYMHPIKLSKWHY